MLENITGLTVIYAIGNCLWNPGRERSSRIHYILVTHKIGPNLLPPPNYCLEISQNSVIQSTHCKCLLCTSSHVLWHTGNWSQKSSDYSLSKCGTLLLSLGASPAASLFALAPISPVPRYSHKFISSGVLSLHPFQWKNLVFLWAWKKKYESHLNKHGYIYLHFYRKSLYFRNTLLSHNCPLLPKVQWRFGVSFTIYINLWHCIVHCLCIVPQCWAICNAFLDSCFMEKRTSCWLVWPRTYRDLAV